MAIIEFERNRVSIKLNCWWGAFLAGQWVCEFIWEHVTFEIFIHKFIRKKLFKWKFFCVQLKAVLHLVCHELNKFKISICTKFISNVLVHTKKTERKTFSIYLSIAISAEKCEWMKLFTKSASTHSNSTSVSHSFIQLHQNELNSIAPDECMG
jgi:hypothetical protein